MVTEVEKDRPVTLSAGVFAKLNEIALITNRSRKFTIEGLINDRYKELTENQEQPTRSPGKAEVHPGRGGGEA